MKVLVALDSFKGSLSSLDAGNAVKEGVLMADSTAQVTVLPLADGGEGTVAALHFALGGQKVFVSVTGPLGDRVKAEYIILPDKKTAVMEIAAAAGITLVEEEKRDPLKATTFGVGEMIADAVKRGCREFIIGIGGSATNDGGAGMLSALGFSLADKSGREIKRGAAGLKDLYRINGEKALPKLKYCSFLIACDVNNVLCGDNGCSAVFGAQKGASERDIKAMDGWLKNFAERAKEYTDKADPDFSGSGAAGGLGFAFLTFLNSKLKPGIDIVFDETGFEEKVKEADIVITGEGRIDGQTAMGKAPSGVARIAKKHGKKVIALAGTIGENARLCNSCGTDAYFSVINAPCTVKEAMNKETARKNLIDTAEQVIRLIKA